MKKIAKRIDEKFGSKSTKKEIKSLSCDRANSIRLWGECMDYCKDKLKMSWRGREPKEQFPGCGDKLCCQKRTRKCTA